MPRALELLLIFVSVASGLRWAAGALAPKAMLATLLFLITRLPVLIVWALGATGWAIAFLTLHRPGAEPMPALIALPLSAFLGLGVAAIGVGPAWMVLRAFAPNTLLKLEPGERELSRSAANHFLRGEARGGKLIITDLRVIFLPHRFNVQVELWSAPIASIQDARTSGAAFLIFNTGPGSTDEWIVTPHAERLATDLQRHADRPRREPAHR